jgi:HEAT repeat protein
MKSGSESHAEGPEVPCGTSGLEAAHAATIRRMIKDVPPFRPFATPEELVAEFANSANRMSAFLALYARGQEALPAVREGLKDANWHIRHWSAVFADNFADAETLQALVPLLRDPKAQVRLWAVHSLSCESCKDGPNPIDAVPLLLERIESDASLKVRRQSVAMLAHHRSPDVRVLAVFKRIMAEQTDRKLRLHAEVGLKRYAVAGLCE